MCNKSASTIARITTGARLGNLLVTVILLDIILNIRQIHASLRILFYVEIWGMFETHEKVAVPQHLSMECIPILC